MQCLKCGKDTKNEQVFCPRCLEVMENYPVKADVRIQLPNHATRDLSKKSARKRRPPSAVEQIAALRAKNRRLMLVILALVLLLGAAGYLLARVTQTAENVEWGKNYTFDSPLD